MCVNESTSILSFSLGMTCTIISAYIFNDKGRPDIAIVTASFISIVVIQLLEAILYNNGSSAHTNVAIGITLASQPVIIGMASVYAMQYTLKKYKYKHILTLCFVSLLCMYIIVMILHPPEITTTECSLWRIDNWPSFGIFVYFSVILLSPFIVDDFPYNVAMSGYILTMLGITLVETPCDWPSKWCFSASVLPIVTLIHALTFEGKSDKIYQSLKSNDL